MRTHILYAARRITAALIDAWAVGACVFILMWVIGAVILGGLTPQTQAMLETIIFTVTFYCYHTLCEGARQTTLGKWSFKLHLVSTRENHMYSFRDAAVRNSWIFLSLITLYFPNREDLISAVITIPLIICIILFGRHPFDAAAKAELIDLRA